MPSGEVLHRRVGSGASAYMACLDWEAPTLISLVVSISARSLASIAFRSSVSSALTFSSSLRSFATSVAEDNGPVAAQSSASNQPGLTPDDIDLPNCNCLTSFSP